MSPSRLKSLGAIQPKFESLDQMNKLPSKNGLKTEVSEGFDVDAT
jgi:hypothetical protein